jgi:hypothetical protein
MAGDDNRGTVDVSVCHECGATGQTGVFCDDCGAVLRARALGAEPAEYEKLTDRFPGIVGTPASAESVPAPAADQQPEMPTRDEIREVLGYVESSRPSTVPPPGVPEQGSEPLAAAPDTTPTEARERARELIVPVADRAPVENPIGPMAPGMPEPARPAVRTHQAHEVTGGVPCPWCGTANPVDRHYCRRCAMSLASPTVAPVRPRWWRRLLDWRRRPVPYAGQRPRLRRAIGRLVRWTVGIALVLVLVFEADAYAGTVFTNTEDHFLTPVKITTSDWSVPDSLSQYPPTNLYDGFNNTWWGSDKVGESAGVTLTAKFAQPIDLLDLIITPGAGTDPTVFYAESRPQIIDVTLTKTDGTTAQSTLTFNDAVGPETFKVRGNHVSSIVFTIRSAYLGSGPAKSTYLAIAEIEFFARSSQHS